MLKKKICPSMMCADLLQMRETLALFKTEGIEYLHIDVMDGHFVPNFQIGTEYIRQLRAASDIPLDVHLMIERPEEKLDWFDFQPGEYVSVHYEATNHVQRALAQLRERGCRTMLALNPATPLRVLEHVAGDCDAVLLMTVNPGFAGQTMIPMALQKIAKLREYLDHSGYAQTEIEADGNVSFANAAKMSEAGVNLFVAGSSSVFAGGAATTESIRIMRKAIAV